MLRTLFFPTTNRYYNLLIVAVMALTGALLVWFVVNGPTNVFYGNDFGQYYTAIQNLLKGKSPYLESYPFILPLWSVLPYLWLAPFSSSLALNLWTIFNGLLIGLLLILNLRILQFTPPVWAWTPLLFCTLLVCNGGWLVSQPTIVIACGLGLGLWWAERRNSPFLSGLCSLLFLLLKPQITLLLAVLLILWYALKGKWRFWQGAIVASVVIGLITLILSPSWPFDYTKSFSFSQTGAGYVWQTTTMLDWLFFSFQITGTTAYIIYGIFILAVLGGLGWFFWQARHGRLDFTALYCLTIAAWMTITPYTRDYDYPVLVLPMLFVLVELCRKEENMLARWLGIAALVFCPLYYQKGGLMYELYLLNLLVCGLTFWRCYQQFQRSKNERMWK
jgi:hypothetical protein